MNRRLSVCIVPRNCGEEIAAVARHAGAMGGTILMGCGTAENSIIQLLGLGDSSKDIVLNIVDADKERCIREAIVRESTVKKRRFGIIFSIDVARFAKGGESVEIATGVDEMDDESKYRMINVIVNKGYAEDVMAAARRAGARGGTIINARGTAKEDDARFFGVRLVPEKELLIILVGKDCADAVFEAVHALPCMAEKGSGVEFTLPVRSFETLGG